MKQNWSAKLISFEHQNDVVFPGGNTLQASSCRRFIWRLGGGAKGAATPFHMWYDKMLETGCWMVLDVFIRVWVVFIQPTGQRLPDQFASLDALNHCRVVTGVLSYFKTTITLEVTMGQVVTKGSISKSKKHWSFSFCRFFKLVDIKLWSRQAYSKLKTPPHLKAGSWGQWSHKNTMTWWLERWNNYQLLICRWFACVCVCVCMHIYIYIQDIHTNRCLWTCSMICYDYDAYLNINGLMCVEIWQVDFWHLPRCDVCIFTLVVLTRPHWKNHLQAFRHHDRSQCWLFSNCCFGKLSLQIQNLQVQKQIVNRWLGHMEKCHKRQPTGSSESYQVFVPSPKRVWRARWVLWVRQGDVTQIDSYLARPSSLRAAQCLWSHSFCCFSWLFVGEVPSVIKKKLSMLEPLGSFRNLEQSAIPQLRFQDSITKLSRFQNQTPQFHNQSRHASTTIFARFHNNDPAIPQPTTKDSTNQTIAIP